MHRLQKVHAEIDLLPSPRNTKSYSSGCDWLGTRADEEASIFLMRLSFLSDRLTLGLHRPSEVGSRRPFKRQSITNFPYDALLQRMNEVHASVAAGDFGRLQVQLGQLLCTAQRLT